MKKRILTALALIVALCFGASAAYWWPASFLYDRWSDESGKQIAQPADTNETKEKSSETEAETEPARSTTTDTTTPPSSFATEPMIIGTTPVFASVADEREERIQGLSGVPSLQENEVKLFVFPHDDTWSFWMKDMNFSIDMIWVDASSTVVYIEENVAPETFPTSFEPTAPARYVIETVAGFAERHNIGVGDPVTLPE